MAWQPHLIWMDRRMPVMGGYEAIQRIRAREALQDGTRANIIVISASCLENEREAAIARGADDFLRKPFKEPEIFDLLTKHLGVKFVYEDESATLFLEETALLIVLAQLPNEMRERLRYAAECCDITQIERAITDIQISHPTAAAALAELANNFEYDKILSAL